MKKLIGTTAGQATVLVGLGVLVVYMAERKAKQAAMAISPTNPDNIFAAGVDGVGASLTGNENFKLGGWLYDVFN